MPKTPAGIQLASQNEDRSTSPVPNDADQGQRRTLGQLTEIWQGVLKIDDIGMDDELPNLGRRSMQVIQIAVRVEKVLGVKLPIEVVLEKLTLRSVAEAVDELRRQGASNLWRPSPTRRPGAS
jgi:acyl carrier protein